VDAHLSPRRPELITTGQLLASLGKHRFQIVDARSEKEYCGDDRRAKRNGAIPGALNLDWVQLLDPKTRRFKTPAELTRLFRDAHIDLGRPTVAHCQSGGRAAAMVFALDLMGARDVRNYYRGWSEWGNARDTPIVTPKPQE
jgi:thiosulfate/3-mercaptopyruvate sulfurtransferase